MSASPCATNVASPPDVIVTTAWLELSHVACPVTVCVDPSENVAVAVNWTVSPTTGDAAPLTVTEVTVTAGGGVGPGLGFEPPLLPQPLARITQSDSTTRERRLNAITLSCPRVAGIAPDSITGIVYSEPHETFVPSGPCGPRPRDLSAGGVGAVDRDMALDGGRSPVRERQPSVGRSRRHAVPIAELDHGIRIAPALEGTALRERHAVVRADDGHGARLRGALPDGRSVPAAREYRSPASA